MEDCCYCQHRNSCMERSRCYPCTSYKKEERRKTTYGLSDGRKHRNWAAALGHGKRRTSTPGRRTKENTLELYRIEEDTSKDYPEERLRATNERIWYRELSVYDTTRAKLAAASVEVTMKLAIPQYKKINSKCVCMIDGKQHEIYNVAHVTTKDGFKESELTLKTPAYDREVI